MSADLKKCSQQVGLPNGFAAELLDLEIQVEQTPTEYLVLKLVKMYSVRLTQTAMEHYEMLQDSKYRHYHQRLQNVLRQSILQQPREETKTHRESRPPTVSLPLIRESEEVWRTHEHHSANSGQMVAENILRQENCLHSKIRARRTRYISRVGKHNQLQEERINEKYAKQIAEIQRISMNEELLKRLLNEIQKKKQEELAAARS